MMDAIKPMIRIGIIFSMAMLSFPATSKPILMQCEVHDMFMFHYDNGVRSIDKARSVSLLLSEDKTKITLKGMSNRTNDGVYDVMRVIKDSPDDYLFVAELKKELGKGAQWMQLIMRDDLKLGSWHWVSRHGTIVQNLRCE